MQAFLAKAFVALGQRLDECDEDISERGLAVSSAKLSAIEDNVLIFRKIKTIITEKAWRIMIKSSWCSNVSSSAGSCCLMTNHDHLLIKTPEGNLSHGMRHLSGVSTQRFNRCR